MPILGIFQILKLGDKRTGWDVGKRLRLWVLRLGRGYNKKMTPPIAQLNAELVQVDLTPKKPAPKPA
jgi:hypothetical protein